MRLDASTKWLRMLFAGVSVVLNLIPLTDVLSPEKLEHPKLNVLQANAELYTVLALQPKGDVLATAGGIGHADAALASETMHAFLSLATEGDSPPDLVIAPEYSTPWEVLQNAVEIGVVPTLGKLWALGCESLPLGGLDAVRARLGGKAIVIDEKPNFAVATTQRYLNPLVYLFRTNDASGAEHLVLLVQYKTEVSGDGHNTEATGMFAGRNIYLLGRQPDEVRLLTLICSDAFKFQGDLVTDVYQGLFVLHIQLNNNPRHPLYKPYRKELFKYGGDTEVFCLNWAANVELREDATAQPINWKNIGGSAWYLRPPQADRTDAHLSANQRMGLYYCRYEPLRVDALQFHYAPRAFLLRATKVLHHGVIGAASYRTGPSAIAAFEWSPQQKIWAPVRESINDGFSSIVERSRQGIDLDEWNAMHTANPINVERVLSICAGTFGPAGDWHNVTKLDSMKMCENEVMWRATVDLDPEAADFRARRFSAGRTLTALRAQEYVWPVEVGFLNDGFRFSWSKQNPHRNALADNGQFATIVYAGAITDAQRLDSIDSQARQALAHIPEPEHVLTSEDDIQAHRLHHQSLVRRICILYQDGGQIRPYRNIRERKISVPASDGPVSISIPARLPTEPDNLKGN